MKSPQRVVWSEGLLISPQHLQQQDLYHERLLTSRLDAMSPLSWGVVSVQIDRRALGAGQLTVQELVAVLPDGLALSLQAGHPELPPSRPVEGHFPHTQTVLEVYVAVPRERSNTASYSENGAPRVRYTIDHRAVGDLVDPTQQVQVAFGRRNVQILFGDEPRDDFDSIKIAEVVRDDAGGLVISEPYVPPCLRISASPFVAAGLRRILSAMATRQKSLSEARRQRDASSIEFNAADVTRFLLLNAVNTFFPVMNHMVDAPDQMSPRECYLLLCQLAGALATFSADEDPSTLPKFVYTDLRSTFEALFARITALLHATVKAHYIAIPLATREDGVHFARLESEQVLKSKRFLISVKSDRDEREIASQLPRLSKIASWNDVNGILTSATPGVPVEVTYRPPPEIPIKAGLVYFTLSTDNAYFRNILGERTFALYLPHPFDPKKTNVELLVIPPAGAG